MSLRSILILSSYLCLGHPRSLFPSDFQTKIMYTFVISAMYAICLTHLTLFILIILILFANTIHYLHSIRQRRQNGLTSSKASMHYHICFRIVCC
jgi:hypothetical protein